MAVSSIESINTPRHLIEKKSVMITSISVAAFFESKRGIPKKLNNTKKFKQYVKADKAHLIF